MSIPRPGRTVRGSRSGRPIMAAFDLLGRRMALRIIWELRDHRRLNFRALQDAAETNPSVLNTRIGELREAGLVDHDGAGYGLTSLGAELLEKLAPLHAWAEAWARKTGAAS